MDLLKSHGERMSPGNKYCDKKRSTTEAELGKALYLSPEANLRLHRAWPQPRNCCCAAAGFRRGADPRRTTSDDGRERDRLFPVRRFRLGRAILLNGLGVRGGRGFFGSSVRVTAAAPGHRNFEPPASADSRPARPLRPLKQLGLEVPQGPLRLCPSGLPSPSASSPKTPADCVDGGNHLTSLSGLTD